jgi:genome maintenance exonuclease 1
MIIKKYEYTKTPRVEINGKRHYRLPDGSAVASVTTILDKTKSEESKQKLQEWRRRVGAQKAQEITTEAAGRGTRMHKWLEDYITNGSIGQPGSNPYSIQSHNMASSIIQQGLPNVNEFWGVELPLYFSGLYAGTTDCVGTWKGKEAIIDFKQSNKPKKKEWIGDYFNQLCAYAAAHNNMHNTNIKTGVILMAVAPPTPLDPPEYQEFIIEGEEFDYWENAWWDRVEKYYREN